MWEALKAMPKTIRELEKKLHSALLKVFLGRVWKWAVILIFGTPSTRSSEFPFKRYIYIHISIYIYIFAVSGFALRCVNLRFVLRDTTLGLPASQHKGLQNMVATRMLKHATEILKASSFPFCRDRFKCYAKWGCKAMTANRHNGKFERKQV